MSINNLPVFSNRNFSTLVADLTVRLNDNRQKIEQIVHNGAFPTWENTMIPLSIIEESLSRWWSPIAHLHHVCHIEALKAVYEKALSALSFYETDMGQHKGLYERLLTLSESEAFQAYSLAQKKSIDDTLLAFRLSGVALEADSQQIFKQNSMDLDNLSTQFDEHLMEATESWSLLITAQERLRGIPESALQLALQKAVAKGEKGWLLTLDAPSYQAIMCYAEDRSLRQTVYEAYTIRASSLGKPQWNNEPVLRSILEKRRQNAQLLGFEQFAALSVVDKMAKKPEAVLDFLNEIVEKVLGKAKQEAQELQDFVFSVDPSMTALSPWDIGYWSERYKQACYQVDDEAYRDYFPLAKVLSGLNEILTQLFGISLKRVVESVDVWDPAVEVYVLKDREGKAVGYLYADWLSRLGKREGAWMDNPVSRVQTESGIQLPVAFLVCNFRPAVDGKPVLLTHDDVVTLFHEVGHCLHHLLTEVDVWGVSGISGVPWDAVEFPSQFLEHFCWRTEVLPLISAHYQTGEPLPESWLTKLLLSQRFQAALSLCRQLVLSLFDFRLHHEGSDNPQALFLSLQQSIGIWPSNPRNQFPCHFSHIFAGGYAAGYYSYLWAEVLAADAFSLFEEEGILNASLGQRFKENILSAGGVESPNALFARFRGRAPCVDALFRYRGL